MDNVDVQNEDKLQLDFKNATFWISVIWKFPFQLSVMNI